MSSKSSHKILNHLKIRRDEIPAIIEQVSQKGARPISIVLKTDKKLLKKNRVTGKPHHYGDFAIKISKLNAFVNFDYEKSVNAQREREGKPADFKRKSNWFKHSSVESRALACLPGEKCNYLQLKVEKRLSEKFLSEEGKTLQKRWIENLLPAKPKAHNQGLEKDVVTICPKLESILEFTCETTVYHVVN